MYKNKWFEGVNEGLMFINDGGHKLITVVSLSFNSMRGLRSEGYSFIYKEVMSDE